MFVPFGLNIFAHIARRFLGINIMNFKSDLRLLLDFHTKLVHKIEQLFDVLRLTRRSLCGCVPQHHFRPRHCLGPTVARFQGQFFKHDFFENRAEIFLTGRPPAIVARLAFLELVRDRGPTIADIVAAVVC